jgi:hypothetical protein
MPYLKLSLKRDPGIPAGQTSPMHLDCPCGQQVPINDNVNPCACGAEYNARGYVITARPETITDWIQRNPVEARNHGLSPADGNS